MKFSFIEKNSKGKHLARQLKVALNFQLGLSKKNLCQLEEKETTKEFVRKHCNRTKVQTLLR